MGVHHHGKSTPGQALIATFTTRINCPRTAPPAACTAIPFESVATNRAKSAGFVSAGNSSSATARANRFRSRASKPAAPLLHLAFHGIGRITTGKRSLHHKTALRIPRIGDHLNIARQQFLNRRTHVSFIERFEQTAGVRRLIAFDRLKKQRLLFPKAAYRLGRLIRIALVRSGNDVPS